MHKIMTPIDFDTHGIKPMKCVEPDIAALKYGCEFASRFDLELHVLHVIQNVTEIEMCTHEAEEAGKKILNDLLIEPLNPILLLGSEAEQTVRTVLVVRHPEHEFVQVK